MSTWTKQKIGELLDNGIIHAIQDGNHGELHPSASDYVTDGNKIPFIMANNVYGNSVDLENCKFISKKIADKLKIGFANEGDVILTHKGTVGEVAIVPKSKYPYIMLTPQVTYYRINPEKLNPHFLACYFRTPDFQWKIKNFNSQSTRAYIGITAQKQVEILMPPLEKQRKISSVLSAYDDLIKNNEKRIKALEEMAQLLYVEWFVKFKFPGHEKVKMVEGGTEYGMVPEGWGVKNVESLIKRIPVGKKYENKNVFETGDVPVLDQGKSGFIGFHNDEPGIKASIENPVIVFANHTCYQNIIVYPFSAIQNVLPFIPNDERDIFWLHWATKDLIKFNDYKGHWPEFMSKKMIIPNIELTKKFGTIVGKYVAIKYKLESESKTLSKTRNLLIPQLVTGKRELK